MSNKPITSPNPWQSGILITFVTAALSVGLLGCGKQQSETPEGVTVDELATNLVEHATADNIAYFASLLDTAASNQAPRLVEMVKRSGMETNYLGRLRKDSATQARLDYHDPDAECHFQVDLQRDSSGWKVDRVYFCR